MSQLHAGNPEAARVIWTRQKPDARTTQSTAGEARIGGTIRALISATFGLVVFLFWSQLIGTIVLSLSAIILFSALVSPTGLYRGLQGLFATLGNFTGRVLTWLMLVPLFYLFFLPFGLLMRRGRRDALKRYFEPERDSYWEPHKDFSAADMDRRY